MTTDAIYLTHDEATLRDAAALAVDHARRLGADAARASAGADGGCRFVMSGGTVETRLRDGTQSLGITVFCDGRSGSASTMALDAETVRLAVGHAVTIAHRVQPDMDAGLADPSWLAEDPVMPPLFAPCGLSPGELLAAARDVDAALADAAACSHYEVQIDQAGMATREAATALATSTGFCRSTVSSTHGRWAMAIARDDGTTVRDNAQSSDRRMTALDEPATVAARAVARAVAQLGARAMAGGRMPVLFDARVAGALVQDLVGALGGQAQYRRASFLQDAIGRTVAADHLHLIEDPVEPWGLASGGYDGEGIAGSRRSVIENGVAKGYFLSTLSARRLGMRSTGNASGPWNLRLTSSHVGGDAADMRARMGSGLLVTHLLGGATDPVTGTWTRAVAGFRIDRGEIAHPVRDLTLAGRMPDMLRAIVAVGDDVERQGAVRCGSILVSDMTVGADT